MNILAKMGGGGTQFSRPNPRLVHKTAAPNELSQRAKSEKRTANDERPTTALYSVRLNSGTASASVTAANIDR